MLTPKTWTDQPYIVERCEFVISELHVRKNFTCEVRKDRETKKFYVSTGNFLGSETIECDNAEVVLRAIEQLTLTGKRVLPVGSRIVS